MIILEGADGTGKTTLAKLICEKLNMEYVKIPRCSEDEEKDGFKFYMKQAELVSNNSVVDRFHIGEIVYPELYGDERKPLKIWQQHTIERLLQARGTILVHVMANYDFIEQSYLARGDNYSEINVQREYNAFANAIFDSILIPKIYITEYTDNLKFIYFLRLQHQRIQKEATMIENYNSTGNIKNYPVMIVGDKINPVHETKYAFHSTEGCSPYLHEALNIAGCKNAYYLTNAFKVGNTESENIRDILQENYLISPIERIALGNEASELLYDAGLRHVLIKHPSYHKRFRNNVYEYAEMFSRVIP